MKCLIPGQNVKILGRAIHTMARIGDDLYVESLPDCLIFRTINSSDSAFCKVIYDKTFFTYYNHDYVPLEDEDGPLKCKISMKSALMVFKSPSHMDKQVEMCEIKLDQDGTKLIFQLKCKHGIIKTHFLSILESKNMDVAYDINTMSNRLLSSHKVLSEAMSNFQQSEDQLTFEVNSQTFILRNYANSNSELSKITKTQLTIKPAEFETYTIQLDSNITFSMKEFRAMLNLAEAVNLPISIYFETSGKPATFILNNNTTFEANFVIATERSEFNTQSTSISTIKNTSKRKFISDDREVSTKKSYMESNLNEENRLFDFVDLTFEKNTPKNGNRTPLVDRNEDFDDNSNSTGLPMSNTQTNMIKTVFKRCFDKTIDMGHSNCEILVDESDCE